MIKAIVFDLGGVVLTNDWDERYDNYISDFSSHFGLTKDDMKRSWHENWSVFRDGKINEDEFWQRYLKHLKSADVNLAKELWRKHQKADDNMLGLVSDLKKKYKVIALSNISKEWLEFKIKKFNLKKHFDFIVSSGYFGKGKSDKGIYIFALKKLGLEPGECLYIDDVKRNIEIASKLGFNTVQFHDFETLKKALSEMSIL